MRIRHMCAEISNISYSSRIVVIVHHMHSCINQSEEARRGTNRRCTEEYIETAITGMEKVHRRPSKQNIVARHSARFAIWLGSARIPMHPDEIDTVLLHAPSFWATITSSYSHQTSSPTPAEFSRHHNIFFRPSHAWSAPCV